MVRPLAQGSSGLEFSLPDLQRQSLALRDRCRRLADQIEHTKQSLASAARLGAPPRLQARFSRLINKRNNHLVQAKQEADLLDQAIKIYRLVLRQAPDWLGQGGKPELVSPQKSLEQAQKALDQTRYSRERCRRLARANRRLERREAAFAAKAQALMDQAARLRPTIDALERRLEALGQRPEPLPPHLGAPPGLARLQRELEQAHGRAAALELERDELREHQARWHRSRALVRSAWEQAQELAAEAERNMSQARKQALAQALDLGRASVAAGRAASELEEMLGPLRPRELAGQIAACRARAKARSALAAEARRLLAGLEQAHRRLPPLATALVAEAMTMPTGPLPEVARLQELMGRSRELYQAQVAQALDAERQAYQRQARQASQRLEKATQSREQLRRKLAQRQEQARRTLAEMQQTRHQSQERQEQLEKARAELGKRQAPCS